MAKEATARARVDAELKEQAESILAECGLTASQGISLFYRQVVLNRGLPFPVKIPNAKTRRVLRESEKGRGVTRFESEHALYEDLGI
jgi:DNA-damage-inducible protein J